MSAATEPEYLEELKAHYSLKDVKPTGREKIGHGAYGYVEEVEVNGAICAAKKVHRVLLHHNNEGVETFKQKFFAECVIMSKLRHPHVVQFLGVYFPSDDQRRSEEQFEASMGSTPPTHPQGLLLPWLIMELLPLNLAKFLDKDKDSYLPYSIKASLLLDISKGLTYLHSQTPTIIHRDLTAKNILINSALVAKIADFGVARITDPTCSAMSVGPGTIAYMPPEVHSGGLNNHAHYFTSVDIFSFGVIILYTIIQDCPLNLQAPVHPDPDNPGHLIAVSEVDRRAKYFAMAYSLLTDTSAPEYELVGLSKRCLDNDGERRPTIQSVLQELKELKHKIPDKLLEKDKFALMKMAAEGQDLIASGGREGEERDENWCLTRRVQSLESEKQQLQSRVEQLVGEMSTFEENRQRMEGERHLMVEEKRRVDAELVRKEQELGRRIDREIALERRHGVEKDELEQALQQKQQQIDRLVEQLGVERETSQHRSQAIALLEQQDLESQAMITRFQAQINVLQSARQPGTGPNTPVSTSSQPSSLGNDKSGRDESEQLRINVETLKITVQSLKQQITQRDDQNMALKTEAQLLRTELIQKAEASQLAMEKLKKEIQSLKRDRTTTTPPINLPPSLPESGVKVTVPLFWKKCQPNVSSVHCGQAILYKSSILYGGGTGVGDNKRRIVRFDLLKAKWEEFSLYLYEFFAMAVVLGKLLVIGGYDPVKDEYSNRLSEWREVGCNWSRVQGSPLPTPRADAVALGFKKYLIVAGGFNGAPLDRVDILDCETYGQWHSLNMPLPEPAYALQSAFYQDASSGAGLWYLMGTSRSEGLSRRKPVYFITLANLLERRGSWAVLPDPPLSNCGAVTVRGHLLAVGGRDQHGCKKDVHMFFFGTNEWLKVSELQYPRHSVSCVPLSNQKSKFVVLGGQDEEEEYSFKVDQYNINFD